MYVDDGDWRVEAREVPPIKDCDLGLAHRWQSRDLIGGDESRELVTGQVKSEVRGLRHLLHGV